MLSSLKNGLIYVYKVIYGFILTFILDNFDKPDYYEATVLSLANRDEIGRDVFKLFRHYSGSRSGRIIDIPSGTGIISQQFARNKYSVVACDLNQNALAYLRRKNPKVETVLCDMNTQLPFANDFFDGAVSVGANRYIREVDFFTSEIFRVLRPGGLFIWPVFKTDTALWKIHAGLSAAVSFSDLEQSLERAGFGRIRLLPSEQSLGFDFRSILVRPSYFVCYKKV
jgi:ubiquinone/menaquinone biosynthesis C-methylase UbiE